MEVLSAIAQNRLDVAKLKTLAQQVEADAENAQSGNLENKRKQEQKLKMADNLSSLAANNKLVISGKNGEDLLNYFKETTDLVNLNE